MPGNKLKEQTKTKLQRKGEAYMSLAESALTSDPVLQKYYYEYLVKSMKSLSDYLRPLCTKDATGKYPVLTEQNLKDLKEHYRFVSNAAGFLEKESLGKLGRNSALYRISHKLSQMIAQDSTSLRKFRAELNLSFPEQLQAANTQVIQIRNQEKKVMGQYMSSRQAMSAVVRNGDQKIAMRGLFTPKTIAEDPEELCNSFFADYFRENHLDQTSPEGKALAALKKIHDEKHPATADVLQRMTFTSKKKGSWNVQYDDNLDISPKLREWIQQYCFTSKNNKLVASTAVLTMMKACQDTVGKRIGVAKVNAISGIRGGRRLDLRNSAMSAVADLLGMEDIIAKSVPMAVQKDGELVEGNFMMFAKGTDAKNMGENNEFSKMDPKSLNGNVELMKQAANLQILDFICGNTDRHMGNVFYQFDEQHRLIGIQGIDNDTSFGIIDRPVLDGMKSVQQFRSLKDLQFVPEETANAIRALNPEMLRAALQRYGLQQDEIDAACGRFKMLLDNLDRTIVNADPERFKQALGNKKLSHFLKNDRERIYALNDGAIQQIDPAKNLSGGHLFNKISRFAQERRQIADYVSGKTEAPQLEGEQLQNWNEKVSKYTEMIKAYKDEMNLPEEEITAREEPEMNLQKFAAKISKYLEVLDRDNRGFFSSSQEYRNIRHYARIAVDVIRNAKDMNPVYTVMENLDALCTVYLDAKKTDGSLKKNERSAERALAVQELQNTLKNMTEKMPENDHDCYCRLSAIERAGAFRTNTDSASIARVIEGMENTLHAGRTLNAAQLSLNGIFDGITRTTWQTMTDSYHNEIVHMTDALKNTKGLPQSMKERAAALINAGSQLEASSAKMKQIRNELQKFRIAAENYQEVLKRKTISFNGKNTLNITGSQVEGLVILNRLIGLSKKADQGLVQPADPKERLAAMILEKQSANAKDLEASAYLVNYSAFDHHMKDLTCHSEKHLLKQCQELKINTALEQPAVQAPALR